MNLRMVWVTFSIMLLGAVVIFYAFQHLVSDGLLNFALEPVGELLTKAMEDQRTLSEMDPEHTERYRARFEEIKNLRDHYLILEHNREAISALVEIILASLLLGILFFSWLAYFWHNRRQRRRLGVLQTHLEALSAGQTDLQVPDNGRDTLGSIARMIEKTSGVLAVQRRRLANMESLSNWQEAARRHAHEIRTPLTAAQMEVNALASFVNKRAPELADRVNQLRESVEEELDRLKEFTQSFTSFAKIGKPKLRPTKPYAVLEKFCELFAEAWSNLEVVLESEPSELEIDMDKDMVRQVLVNLCNNSSLALGDRNGHMRMSLLHIGDNVMLQLADDGPGVPPEIRANLFKPYTTSRKIGEGMGLGLSIAKKIMLDHGGDLELHETSEAGTSFRLIFPQTQEEPQTWH